jgi:hypothetical protein
VNFGFFADPDTTRYCYLRLRRLKEAIKNQKIVTALAEELGVPGGDRKQAMAAVERRIEELRASGTSVWQGVPAPEVLAAAIFGARKRADGEVERLFCQVGRVDELASPLLTWLKLAGLLPTVGAASGPGRMSLTAHRGGGFISKIRLVALEAVNDPREVDAALDHLKGLDASAHVLYLVCTPALAAEYLSAHAEGARHWDPGALQHKLQESGLGLLMLEGDAVAEVIRPEEGEPSSAAIAGLPAAPKPRRRKRARLR